MSMTVSLHADNVEIFNARGYVTTHNNGELYSVVHIKSNEGYESQEITLFLSQEQLEQLKKVLTTVNVGFKKEIAKRMLEEETTI